MPKPLSSPRQAATLSAAALLCCVSAPALAQETLDVQNFRPALGPRAVYSIEGADVLEHMSPAAGVMLNYASQPLVLTLSQNNRERAVPVIDQQLALHVMMGLGLWDFLQLDLTLPLYAVHDGDSRDLYDDGRGQEFGGFRAGDLGLRLKGRILSSQAEGAWFGLGVGLEGRLPTGDSATFAGESSPIVIPRLIADAQLGKVFLAANVGAALRSTSQVRNLELGSELVYGLGAEWRIMQDMVALGVEVFGKRQLVSQAAGALEVANTPVEALFGVKLHTPSGFSITTGAGAGVLQGYGAPEFRAIVGLTYTDREPPQEVVTPTDTDQDGILDELDACPNQAEDLDGFQDEDGCPDLDNDADGIPDEQDQCPDDPEDVDGFQDEDGCPDADNDADGIPDDEDKCPDQAGVPEEAGCPAPVVIKQLPKRTFTKIVLRAKTIELLDKVFFETNKATIKPESFEMLDEVAALLAQYPQIKLVEISGHTDRKGRPKDNKKLSQERAQSVLTYLTDKGVAPERLKAIGFGQEKPLVTPEKTEDDRAKNRRVEFNILEQDAIMESALEKRDDEKIADEKGADEKRADEKRADEKGADASTQDAPAPDSP